MIAANEEFGNVTEDFAADIVLTEHDPRFTLYQPVHLGELDELLSAQRSTARRSGTTLRERLGLAPANPPAHGRAVFPDPSAQSAARRVSAS